MIRIINLNNVKLLPFNNCVKIDRTTVLGNPFPIYTGKVGYGKLTYSRARACDLYQDYFYEILHRYTVGDPTEKDSEFVKTLHLLYQDHANNHDIDLGCWCYPKRCHGETIKKFLEEEAKEFFEKHKV